METALLLLLLLFVVIVVIAAVVVAVAASLPRRLCFWLCICVLFVVLSVSRLAHKVVNEL